MLNQIDNFIFTLEKKQKTITYLRNIYKIEIGLDPIVPEAYLDKDIEELKGLNFQEIHESEECETFEHKVLALNLPQPEDKNLKTKIAKLKKNNDTQVLIRGLDLSNYEERGFKLDLFKTIVDGLKIIKSVIYVNLRKNKIDDSYIELLCQVLSLESLKRIDISYNNISKVSTKKLILNLKLHDQLEFFDITYNPICFDEVSCQHICRVFKNYEKLYHFGISDHSVDSGIRVAIGKPKLRSLNLDESKYKISTYEVFNKVLYDRKYELAVLSLKFVTLDLLAVGQLEKGLRENSSLIVLNLHSCGLTDKSGSRIISSLETNKTLIELDLSQNKLNTEFCISFKKVFSEFYSNTIQIVDITHNRFIDSNENFSLILEGLINNQSIISLGNLINTKINTRLKESAQQILDLNKKFLEGVDKKHINDLTLSLELGKTQKINYLKSSIDFNNTEKQKRETLDEVKNNENMNEDEKFKKIITKYNISLKKENKYDFFNYK